MKPEERPDRWLEAQVSVIGCALIWPELAPRVITETEAKDYTGDYRTIYCAIQELLADNKPIDPVIVRNHIGGDIAPVLRTAMEQAMTAANFDDYISACKEQARLASLRSVAASLLDAATLDEARALVDKAHDLTAERSHIKTVTMAEAFQKLFDELQAGEKDYLDWGIAALNDNLYVDKGDFVVLGGYPSEGKTALMLQLAWHMAKKHRVGIFSYETSDTTAASRTTSHESKVPFPRIKRRKLLDEDWPRIIAAANPFNNLPIEITESSGMSVKDILSISVSRRYEVVFVDYLQKIRGDTYRGGTRTEEVSRISMDLQTMARRHGMIVIALSQLTRAPKSYPVKKKYPAAGENPDSDEYSTVPAPTMSDLRESGQIEQDADVVMLLYRLYPGTKNEMRRLKIAKNKEGRLGAFNFNFDGSTQTFSRSTHEEITRIAAEARRDEKLGKLEKPTEDNPFAQQELPM